MELGATVCLPRQPRCNACPIRKFCRTRGAGQPTTAKPPQRKRGITYSLTRRGDSILLVRRSEAQSLMPGMWELPEVAAPNASDEPLFSVRHSITVTNFAVRVVARSRAGAGRVVRTRPERSRTGPSPAKAGGWVRIARLNTLPLTGLAKKILRAANIIQ